MWNGLLPIGSIVLLKGGDRRLMIIGYCSSKEGNDDRVYDYTGALYPDGFEDPDSIYLFDKENIERIYYIGYMDEKSEEVLPDVETVLNSMKKG